MQGRTANGGYLRALGAALGLSLALAVGSVALAQAPIPRPAPSRPAADAPSPAPTTETVDAEGGPFEPITGEDAADGDIPVDAAGDGIDPTAEPLALVPQVPAAAPLPDGVQLPEQQVVLEALLTTDGQPIPTGVAWRVFGEDEGADGHLPLLAEASGGTVALTLVPGDYFLHAAFGRAGATQRLYVRPGDPPRQVVLNAGGLRLHAFVGKDRPLGRGEVMFDIMADDIDETGERTLVAPSARPDEIVRLNAGTYHVVSRYGDTNSVVRAAIEVKAGELTDATLYHEAARVTLKLVSERGGEALAGTAWSVLTPAGDSVFESVGAFPTVVLAAGEYTAVARRNDRIFENTFTVEADVNRDIEVLTGAAAP